MTTTEMGEYVVGAYLKLEEQCDFVDYNVRPPGGGLPGLTELDVIGINLSLSVAFLCEVTTHIRGLLYTNNRTTIERVKQKHQRQRDYAKRYLGDFKVHKFMFWSPVVPVGYLTENLNKIDGLDLVINGSYRDRVGQLRDRARTEAHDTGNPFFRAMQITEHLRG